MTTAILTTDGCLRNRFRRETLALDRPYRHRRNPNPRMIKPNNRRKSESMVTKSPGKNLVMGQVKILKRGETLTTISEKKKKKTDLGRSNGSRVEEAFDLALGSTNRLGPDPETMQKQVKLKESKIGGFYAGTASFVSPPPPSSVPVPGFLGRTAKATPGRMLSASQEKKRKNKESKRITVPDHRYFLFSPVRKTAVRFLYVPAINHVDNALAMYFL
ncbi:hypothetical protein GQ457_10G002300 [Hibiscus cannabinus]